MSFNPARLTAISKRVHDLDPRLWQDICKELDEYVFSLAIALTEATPDKILVAQGHAQQARSFLRLFAELPRELPKQPTP
jgi:hypothetical protein